MTRSRILAAATALGLGLGVPAALGAFSRTVPVGGNIFATATLAPPTDLTATASCQSTLAARITLNWTATSSEFATGYEIYRSTQNGGPYSFLAAVEGRETTSYVNGNLPLNTRYYYVVRSVAQSWLSVNSNQATAITPALCLL